MFGHVACLRAVACARRARRARRALHRARWALHRGGARWGRLDMLAGQARRGRRLGRGAPVYGPAMLSFRNLYFEAVLAP